MVDFKVLKPDYEFYSGKYNGTIITQSSFEFYIEQANQIVWNYIHFNSYLLEGVDQELEYKVKMAQCGIADLQIKYGVFASAEKKEVASESAGKVSVTYSNITNQVAGNITKYEKDILRMYLGDTGLLYRGVALS